MAKKKKIQPIDLTMDMILKMTPEIFRDTVKAQDMGFKISLQNLLKMQFEQCVLLKDSLVASLEKVTESDRDSHNKALEDVYICLQLIEDRHLILTELIDNNGVESRNVKH